MTDSLSPNHSYCFKCLAIPIGWAVDEVWPVVRAAINKVYHAATHAFTVMHQEFTSYASSGISESKKSVVFLGECYIEMRHFHKGTLRKVFYELGGYLRSGGCELVKGAITLYQAGNEVLRIAFDEWIRPFIEESASYLISGGEQVLQYAWACVIEGKAWIYCAFYKAVPVAMEVLSYAEAGMDAGIKGFKFLRSSFNELLIFAAALKEIMTELLSYGESAKHETAKGSEFASHALQETKEEVEHLNQCVTEELVDAIDSSVNESKNLTFKVFMEALPAFEMYIRPILREVKSYAVSGFGESIKAVKSAAISMEKASKPLKIALREARSYVDSGYNEVKKGFLQLLPEMLQEISLLVNRIPCKIAAELSSYAYAGLHVFLRACIGFLRAMQELTLLPEEAALTTIRELRSYLNSLNGELGKADQLLKRDVPTELKHSIGDPLKELTMEFVYEYRRWRAQRA